MSRKSPFANSLLLKKASVELAKIPSFLNPFAMSIIYRVNYKTKIVLFPYGRE